MASDEAQWPRRSGIRVLAVLGIIAFLTGFVWLWWAGAPLLYRGVNDISPADRLKAITDTRTALLAGLAALGALGTFWLNGRAQRFTAQTLRVSQQTYRITERGHLTDRYTKAIEQLGSDTLDVRLGGIYGLEQLATDSDNPRDQTTIVEVLSAFVRVHSDPLYRHKPPFSEAAPAQPPEQLSPEAAEYVARLKRPPVDVQAAVTVLGCFPTRSGSARVMPDLGNVHLNNASLRRANLSGTNLSGASLRSADLTMANLSRANLEYANLRGAFLGEADLTGTTLHMAKLDGAYFGRAGSFTSGRAAILGNASLIGAELTGSHLGEADLTGADIAAADLSGADLTQARGLVQEQINQAFGDSRTKLPLGLERPESWSDRESSGKLGSGS